MYFQIRPILAEIKELYQKPITPDRFKQYIAKLQGDSKGDLQLPISGFNPMAKEHVLQKINELEKINAEKIMHETITKFNEKHSLDKNNKFDVVLNLADDRRGGWTNRHTTDFDSKFKLNALINRNFCTPYFWTSETYDEQLIRSRTTQYLNRTLYWSDKPKPRTLEDHVKQEVFAYKDHIGQLEKTLDFNFIESFYSANKNAEIYNLIFNFFYGDEVSTIIGYKCYGIKKVNGVQFTKYLAHKKKS